MRVFWSLFLSLSFFFTSLSLANDAPTIVRVEKRNLSIMIKSTTEGMKYFVENTDGQTIAANLSEDELKVQHPEVYQTVKTGLASPLGDGNWYLDATNHDDAFYRNRTTGESIHLSSE